MVADKLRDAATCLSSEEVQLLLAGKMAADDLATIVLHVANCKTCRSELRKAGVDDATLSQKDPRSVDTTIGEAAAGKQSERPTLTAVHQDVWPEGTKAVSEKYPFLAPPRATDELGRLGSYRILRVLGEGGMGTVFEGEDSQLRRRVAVKVLRQGLDGTTRQRFLQEAQLAASLASNRIVTIFHIGEDRGCPYLVMELLQGETLDARLNHVGKLSLSDSLRIAREVAEGLTAAHDKGLIHRDIKPANVWLARRSEDDPDDRVKLLDFGIARSMATDVHLTEDGMIVGTPSYMCPEQAHGAPLDARSDLFSLGCLLYAMLSGESPFVRANTILSIRAVAEEEASPIRDKLPHMPTPIAALIHRLLAKQPKDRPASARGVVEEIRCLEMLVQPTVGLPAGLPTALGLEQLRAGLQLGWKGWGGIAAVVIAVLAGVWWEYDHLLGRQTPQRAAEQLDLAIGVPAGTTRGQGSGSQGKGAQRTGDHTAGDDATAAAPAVVPPAGALPPIKVGILHSFSGPMATSERTVADAFLFAIDEINAAGGLLGGRQIEPIMRDGKSYADIFAQQAEDLISKEQVATLFGAWRSSCRKSVAEVCQAHDHLLVFPKADEGLEQSPYVMYMGGAPNQQTTPPVRWAYADLGKRKFFLVGTEGLFSRASAAIIKDEVAALGASVVGEEYCPVGDAFFAPVVAKIKESGADVVLNTVSGSGNIALFRALAKADLKPDVIPVISYDLTEEELRTLSESADTLAGNYASWSYFQSLPEKANQDFIQRFRKRFGPTRIVNDPMAAAYAGMHLWALGVEAAKSDRPADIRRAMVRQRFQAPEGLVTIDPANQRAVRMARIGQIGRDLEFEVVWVSPRPVTPVVFPPTRSRQAWEQFLAAMRERFDGQWSPEAISPENRRESTDKVNNP